MSQKLQLLKAYAAPATYTDAALDAVNLTHARELWRHHRITHGFAATVPPLIAAPDSNAKLDKSKTPTYGLSLSPHRLAAVGNVCPHSTPQCRELCLASAGKGRFGSVQRGRQVRTTFLAAHPLEFRAMMRDELQRTLHKYGRRHLAFRPNVLSDLPWEREPWLDALPARLHVYGYTKRPSAVSACGRVDMTFSISERQRTFDEAEQILEQGTRVAVVTAAELPKTFRGWPVIDGDKSDERWKDPVGIVLLRPKGKARDIEPTLRGFVKPAEWFAA